MTKTDQVWPRVIILIDMNCFFAAVEQLDHPEWRQRPVAVTNGSLGTTIITSSYEARAYGIKTGMRLKQARQLCPDLIQAPSRPERYAGISTKIMASLQCVSPDIEVYSIDEAFLDVTHCQSLLGAPLAIGRLVKQTVTQVSDLKCSVGISGDKTTAKYAAKLHKPDGLTLINPWDAEQTLAPQLITELSGINKGIAGFLKEYGVVYCGDMKKLPISVLAKRYGNPGRRIWLMAQGKDPENVQTEVKLPKTMGHGKTLPPETKDKQLILTYLQHMSEKVALRLRRHHFRSNYFFIGLKTQQGWLTVKAKTLQVTDDGKIIFSLCQQFTDDGWQGQGVWQVQVTALNLQTGRQTDLFDAQFPSSQRNNLNHAIDDINQKFGEFAIAPSRLLGRSAMPNVIAPSWKPSGHRKTI